MEPVFIIMIIFGGFAIGAFTGFFAAKQLLKKNQNTAGNQPDVRSTVQSEFTRSGYRSLPHLWRKKDGESLAVEIEGVMFPDRTSMSAEAMRRNKEIALEWLAWLGASEEHMPQGTASQAAAAQSAVAQSAAPQDQQTVMPEPPKIIKTEKIISAAPTHAEVLEEIQSKRIEAELKIKTFRDQTIAEQIDTILQEKILEAGLTSRDIRIIEDLKQSVIFQVGDKSYTSLNELDDPDTLRLIRSAVAEWEKRTAALHHR